MVNRVLIKQIKFELKKKIVHNKKIKTKKEFYC